MLKLLLLGDPGLHSICKLTEGRAGQGFPYRGHRLPSHGKKVDENSVSKLESTPAIFMKLQMIYSE